MKSVFVFLFLFLIIPSAAVSQPPPVGSIALYLDDDRCAFGFNNPGEFIPFDMYVWTQPGENGMICAEFAVSYPANVIESIYDESPLVSVSLGNLHDGISACLVQCADDWIWLYRQTLYLSDANPSYLEILPHPDVGAMQFANCEPGFPTEPCTYLNGILLNPGGIPPEIYNVEIVSGTELKAHIPDNGVVRDIDVFMKDYPDQSVPVADFYTGYDQQLRWNCFISLGELLQPGVVYTVGAHYLTSHHWYGLCTEYTEKDFAYIPIATTLASSGARLVGGGIEIAWRLVDPCDGCAFSIDRLDGGSAAPRELDPAGIDRDGAAYRYFDRDCEPGTGYRYRVSLDGGEVRTVLFETDEIATPALPFALHQNHPNPCNPSTAISFYLPDASYVELDIFDASGRLVDRIADGYREAGEHSVNWRGTDNAGREAASGVYLYRLTAGKETRTRKMILLR